MLDVGVVMEIDFKVLPPEADRRQVGKRIRSTRKALGLTQRQVYERLGIQKTTYGNHDTGYSRPLIEDGIKIARLFDVTLEWIYLGDISRVPHDLAVKIQSIMSEDDG